MPYARILSLYLVSTASIILSEIEYAARYVFRPMEAVKTWAGAALMLEIREQVNPRSDHMSIGCGHRPPA